VLEQPGDDACSEWNEMEWNDQGCLVGGMTACGRTHSCYFCQATAISMVGCSNQIIITT